MKWAFQAKKSENDQVKLVGQYVDNDCIFVFSGRSTPNGKYPCEIRIRLLSPTTGKTLQVEGAQRREKKKKLTPEEMKAFEMGKQVEKLNAVTTVYCTSLKEQAIKDAVKKGAQRLYKRNYLAVQKSIKRMAPVGSIHAMAMFHTYQKEFFLSQSTKEKDRTREEKKKALESICAALDAKPVNELSVKDLRSVYLTLAKSKADWLFGVARKFFEYCRGKAYTGINPVTAYLDYYAAKNISNSPGGRKAAKIHRIDQDKEEILQRRTNEKIGTPFAMVIPLAKDAGLNVDEIWKLKWADVLIEGEGAKRTVRIRNFHPNYKSGTQNFTRPLLPPGRFPLLAHYDFLRATYTAKALKGMYVVPDAKNPQKQANKSAITAYIRSELLQSGIRYEILVSCNIQNPKSPGGVGIVLCREHYAYMLEEQCGIEPSSGEKAFMLGEEINQVTDNYYVSYIGADGVHRLEGLVRRDSRFAPEPASEEPITEQVLNDGGIEKTLNAAGADKLTGCLGKLVIPPGGQLNIYSTYGLHGDIKARISGHNDLELKKFDC